jgi:hypothetical protein
LRRGTLSGLALLSLALLSAAFVQSTSIVGSWRGTSICVDKVHWPACHDEEVVYDVQPKPGVRDTVTLRADKIVNGAREFMAEFDFFLAADSSWVSEFHMGRSQGRVVLRIARTHMTGTLTDVPSGRTVRNMALDRMP